LLDRFFLDTGQAGGLLFGHALPARLKFLKSQTLHSGVVVLSYAVTG